jgi:predicted permease
MAAVISERLWARRFGRDPGAIGRVLTIGGTNVPIVGVMPRTFTPANIDVWLPAQTSPYMLQLRNARYINGIGRMKPGVTVEQARQDLNRVQRSLGEQFPDTDRDWSARVQDLKATRITGQERPLWLVFAAVLLLWLIGIANVAALMVTEMRRRGRELAVRAAIGASRRQIVGTVMREVFLLAAAGCTVGVVLAAWLVAAVPAMLTTLPRISEIAFSGRATAFAAITGMAAALLFGAWPAWHATRGSLAASISQGGRGASGPRHRLQQTLVVAQVALSVLLAGSAMLLARTYLNLVRADTGFSADGAITFHMGARWDEDRPKVGQLQADFVAGLQRIPGVEAAGFANFLPMTGATLRSYVSVQGLAGTERDGTIMTGTRMIGGSYLRAMKIAVVSGGECPPLKMDFAAPRHALVNRRFVDQHANGENLVGRDLKFAVGAGPFKIVGIVADVVEDAPGASVVPYVYTCQSAGSWPDPEYVVRGSDQRAIIAGARQLMKTLDPGRAIFAIRPVDEVVSLVLERPRVSAAMFAVFAASALALASLGLYSLFMLIVAESTREIGVRLALGAAPGQVRRLVLSGAGRLCLAGIALGLLLSASARKLISGLLFGVQPLDPATLVVTTVTLAAAAALAIALPVLRAGRVNPIVAMRTD